MRPNASLRAVLDALRRTARDRLVTAADTWERHLIVAELAGRPRTVIDVGGLPGQLRGFLPGASVVAVNVSPPADLLVEPGQLPFRDRSIDVVTSLDTLEHVPAADRPGFVAELVRVARGRLVLCCPLGTPEHVAAEHEVQGWHRELTGAEHPWLTEHIALGLPTADELRAHLEAATSNGDGIRLAYHGDFRAANEQFRAIVRARRRPTPGAVWRFAGPRLAHRPDVELAAAPGAYTNRVFAVVERSASA
jgi:hypothetical protein